MTLTEARELLRERTAAYFGNAAVLFGDQSRSSKQALPLVVLTVGSLRRQLHPSFREGGETRRGWYRCTVPVTVDLFTRGTPRVTETGIIWLDTAQDQLTGFLDYCNSDLGLAWCGGRDLTVLTGGPVKNLSGLLEGTSREYRARAELTLSFTVEAGAFAAPLDLDGGYFTEAEITEAEEEA